MKREEGGNGGREEGGSGRGEEKFFFFFCIWLENVQHLMHQILSFFLFIYVMF